MNRPWVGVRQTSRRLEGGKWIFTWRVEELNGAPLYISWAKIDHLVLHSERSEQNLRAPAELRLPVEGKGAPGDIVEDIILELSVVWEGDDWIAKVPLFVRFDRNGHPDSEAGNAKAERVRVENEPEAIRDRILKAIYQHETNGSKGLIEAAHIAESLRQSVEDVDYHLEILERDAYVELTHVMGGDRNHSAWLTSLGKQRAREGVRAAVPTSHITVGAIIQSMTGGNVQAVGVATNTEVSQVVNDPQMLHELVSDLGNRLVDAVKSDLRAQDLMDYLKSIETLKAELQSADPDPSLVKRLLATLSFMGDVEGTLGLMTRVLPYVSSLVMVADNVIQSMPR